MTDDTTDTTDESDAEPAATLLAEHLRGMGAIDGVDRHDAVVTATTSGRGVHLGNIYGTYECEVHLVCSADEPNAPDPGGGDVFFNIAVSGLEPRMKEGFGHALPTAVAAPDGVRMKEPEELRELPDEVLRAAWHLGLVSNPPRAFHGEEPTA